MASCCLNTIPVKCPVTYTGKLTAQFERIKFEYEYKFENRVIPFVSDSSVRSFCTQFLHCTLWAYFNPCILGVSHMTPPFKKFVPNLTLHHSRENRPFIHLNHFLHLALVYRALSFYATHSGKESFVPVSTLPPRVDTHAKSQGTP